MPFFFFLSLKLLREKKKWHPSWIEGASVRHNFRRVPFKDHLGQVWFNLVLWFQSRRFKCKSLQSKTSRQQTPSDSKSSYCLWPSQQKISTIFGEILHVTQSIISYVHDLVQMCAIVYEKKMFLQWQWSWISFQH